MFIAFQLAELNIEPFDPFQIREQARKRPNIHFACASQNGVGVMLEQSWHVKKRADICFALV